MEKRGPPWERWEASLVPFPRRGDGGDKKSNVICILYTFFMRWQGLSRYFMDQAQEFITLAAGAEVGAVGRARGQTVRSRIIAMPTRIAPDDSKGGKGDDKSPVSRKKNSCVYRIRYIMRL